MRRPESQEALALALATLRDDLARLFGWMEHDAEPPSADVVERARDLAMVAARVARGLGASWAEVSTDTQGRPVMVAVTGDVTGAAALIARAWQSWAWGGGT